MTKLRDELVAALLDLDEAQADRVVGEAHALHPLEDVVLDLFRNTMFDLGQKWHEGVINTTTEHFASRAATSRGGCANS